MDIELGRLIAKTLDVEARFIITLARENVDADPRFNIWKGQLIGGQIANVVLRVPYNRELACRNEQVVPNGHYYNERIGIAFRTSDYPDERPTPAIFRHDSVGAENDTISDFCLSGIAGGQLFPKMRRFPNYDAAMAALRGGEIMAVMGPIGRLEHGLGDGHAVHTPPLPGLASSQWTLAVAVRHNWRPLSYAVDDAISAAVTDGRLKAIFSKFELCYTSLKWRNDDRRDTDILAATRRRRQAMKPMIPALALLMLASPVAALEKTRVQMAEIMAGDIPADCAAMGAMPQEFHRSVSHLYPDIERQILPLSNP